MARPLAIVESGEVSREQWEGPTGVTRFLGEYHWDEVDEPFVDAMYAAQELWNPAIEALRPEWGRHRPR